MGNKKSTSSNSGSSNSGGGRGDGRQETNRRRNEVNPNIVKAGTKKVKKDIGFNQKKHPTEGIVDSYALKSKKGGTGMYGEEASKATNEYLVSIGEAKRSGGGGYILTSKGHKMKYGTYNVGGPQNPTAMGTAGKGGIMNQIPISEKMFESQKKTKAIMLGGLSVFAGPVVGTIMRMGAGDALNAKYSDYQKSFQAKTDPYNANTFSASNKQNNTETANLAMGETTQITSNKKNKSKTTKSTSKYFAGTGQDESNKKRTFYV